MKTPEFGYDPLEGVLLIGQVAIDHHREAGGDYVPLQDIIKAPSAPSEVCKPLQGEWSKDDVVTYGQWLLSIVQDDDPGQALRTPHLRRASEYGIGPHISVVENRFDRKISAFKKAIGSPIANSRGLYRDWATNDYVSYARRLQKRITKAEGAARKLKLSDFQAAADADEGPSRAVLESVTSVSILNEHLGYPNIRSWDEEDYLAWGVHVFRVNGHISSLKTAFDTLSKRQYGPGSAAIARKFGRLVDFADEARARLAEEEDARKKRLSACQTLIEQWHIPTPADELTDQEILTTGAMCTLIDYYEDDILKRWYPFLISIQDPSTLIRAIARYSETVITPAHVEATASMLGIYDDLFVKDYSYLRVT